MSFFLNWEWKHDALWLLNPTLSTSASLALSCSSGGCSTSSATHIVMLCNLSWAENVIYSVQRALMLLLMCNEYEGSGELELLFSFGALALVMRLLVQMGVGGAERWQSCRYVECVCVCLCMFGRGGGEGYMHAWVDCPEGLISKQQGRD